jgi:CRISPR/Cas system-associated endonuclease Cas1
LLQEAATRLSAKKMADQAQLTTMIETVDRQKKELDDKEAALAQAQKIIEDRDRRMQEAIKQNEEEERKMKQQIKLLEDKLKATSLAGGSAAHAGGPGTGLTSSMMGAATG